MQKIYVNDNNEITLRCPRCGKSRDINVGHLIKKDGPLRVSYKFKCDVCDCGHIDCKDCGEKDCPAANKQIIEIERRRHQRKEVKLIGSLIDQNQKRHPMRVVNISRRGVSMAIKTAHNLQLGQTTTVEFTLDDADSTSVTKEIIVRQLSPMEIKGEFTDVDSYDGSNKILGFYLMQ